MVFFYYCILSCFLFAACASKPTVTGVWIDEEYAGHGISSVLVLGVSSNVSAKLMFEDQFVSRLKSKGVDAIASYRVIQAEGELTRENIQSKIEDINADTIILTKVIAKKQEEIINPGTSYIVPRGYRYGYYDYYRSGYQYVHSPTYIDRTPATVTQYEVLSLQTNLYDTKSEKLIMSIQSNLIATGTTENLIKSYIDMVMKEMSSKKIIRE